MNRGEKVTDLEREHVLLEEQVGAADDRAVYAVLGAAWYAWELVYPLCERVVLRESLQ